MYLNAVPGVILGGLCMSAVRPLVNSIVPLRATGHLAVSVSFNLLHFGGVSALLPLLTVLGFSVVTYGLLVAF